MKFFELCDRFPPILVRLLARDKGGAMTNKQIADAMRACEPRPRRMMAIQPEDEFNFGWDFFSLEELRSFTRACHLDFTSPRDLNRVETYLRKNGGKPSFKYLTKDPLWKTYYLPLILNWRKSLKVIPPQLPMPIKRLLESLPHK